jgi:hypothetical protein
MLSIAVISIDILPAKGDAVKVITPDAAVVSAVNKKRSLRMYDSTSIGCRKGVDLTKDRFTKVQITVTAGAVEYWVQLEDEEPYHCK